jgi:hypothetical protein
VNKYFKPEMLKRDQENEEQAMIAALAAVSLLSKREKKSSVIARDEAISGKATSNWRKRRNP